MGRNRSVGSPLMEQFLAFCYKALQGDFGNSLRFGEPAISLLAERLGATIQLALATLFIAVGIGIPAGIVSAYYRNSLLDVAVRSLAAFGQAVPTFYWGVLWVIVTETVFSWPGVGRLVIQAIYARDYPVVQAVVFFFALIFVLSNLLADVFSAVLDPRVRYK